MYKQTLWLLISLILDFSSFAQNQEKLNFFPINTDAINTENYDFLKKELEDKRIVCLGEQVHMDGSSIAARAKLIEYLVNAFKFTHGLSFFHVIFGILSSGLYFLIYIYYF
jgi:hypothetical protein